MSTVYEIMRYSYDGYGDSTEEPSYDPLQTKKEKAEKIIRDMEGWGFTVTEDKFLGLIAYQTQGKYAYDKYYIVERELED